MQRDEKAVCLSVRPSVKRVVCDLTEERSVQYERSFIVVFWEEERLVRGPPLLREIMGQPVPVGEIADFQPIFARSASAVTPSEKKFN